ncbi:hypothetical protein IKF81_00210 [Candidatus Saccharibacteria bacterium]|nr:hypothetical protein [Candidatus Saccharibacteria bacterium]
MMQNFSRVHLVETAKLKNTTSLLVRIYEESTGEIVKLPPKMAKVPKTAPKNNGESLVHYIVRECKLDELRSSGRDMKDIAVIQGEGTNRDGDTMFNLYWGKKPEIKVGLYPGKLARCAVRHL